MITKESLNIFLKSIYKKCDTAEEKRLLECMSYDLNQMIDEATLQKKHFENEIKNLKYVKARPKIEELQNEINKQIKEKHKVMEELAQVKSECKAYKRRVIKLQRFLRNDLYKQEILKQIEKATNRIYQYNYKLDDVEEELKKLRESIEGDD